MFTCIAKFLWSYLTWKELVSNFHPTSTDWGPWLPQNSSEVMSRTWWRVFCRCLYMFPLWVCLGNCYCGNFAYYVFVILCQQGQCHFFTEYPSVARLCSAWQGHLFSSTLSSVLHDHSPTLLCSWSSIKEQCEGLRLIPLYLCLWFYYRILKVGQSLCPRLHEYL